MLPLNFHRTFVPERRLIGALLEYAALGKEGDFGQMSRETGIPMGRSTGKLTAILDYCKGMGLLTVGAGSGASVKKPALTPFGEAVYANDRLIGEELTQWLVHLNLCRSDMGARLWNRVFAQSTSVLGQEFSDDQLEDYLVSHFGGAKRSRIGPLISTYSDNAALGRARVLKVQGHQITRLKAPILPSWATAYSALVIDLIQSFFPTQSQVTVVELAKGTRFFDMCMWQQSDVELALDIMEMTGFVSVDRQIQPWVVGRRVSLAFNWWLIFQDLI